jgi:hypothetical protein
VPPAAAAAAGQAQGNSEEDASTQLGQLELAQLDQLERRLLGRSLREPSANRLARLEPALFGERRGGTAAARLAAVTQAAAAFTTVGRDTAGFPAGGVATEAERRAADKAITRAMVRIMLQVGVMGW